LVVYDLEKEYTFKVKRKVIDSNAENGDEEVDIRGKGDIVLERKFNFEVRAIIADHKDKTRGDRDGLVIVTKDGTVYYTNKGTIATFLPYNSQAVTTAILLDYSFCENSYFLTLH
jgi:hypothetical protein